MGLYIKNKLILISCLSLISCTKQNNEIVDIMFLKQVNITLNYSMFEKVYFAGDKFLITFAGNTQTNTLVKNELISILQNSIFL